MMVRPSLVDSGSSCRHIQPVMPLHQALVVANEGPQDNGGADPDIGQIIGPEVLDEQ